MPTLVGIAAAIEQESAQRYAALAELMDARGAAATAAAFREMHQEELRHVEAVARWAKSVAEPVASPAGFAWLLPPELAASWDEVVGSALLTPYRAFAVAVCNEQRAFAYYSYLAAHATDDRVRSEAEKLAAEELLHAAALRRWRRLAWHRERREGIPVVSGSIEEVAGLDALLGRSWAGILACHRAVAARLREIGDADGARFLEALTAGTVPAAAVAAGSTADPAVAEREAIAASTTSLPLMVIAQRPLERLADQLETVLDSSQGELFDATVAAIDTTVAMLSRIALKTPPS
ncbi:MAG: hypothetical protein M9951_18710 [Burkholderiaceae bacterium]|nr:hypothetical protein [Burkholderiaceae bacterium]